MKYLISLFRFFNIGVFSGRTYAFSLKVPLVRGKSPHSDSVWGDKLLKYH